MRISLIMHIMQAVHHLMEVGSRHLLRKFTSFSHKVKELTTCRVFQDNSKAILSSTLC